MRNSLLSALKPIYTNDLIPQIKDIEPKYGLFCVQWGKNFPKENHNGILFIGRSANGWVSVSHDPDVLFGDPRNDACIFNLSDQMEWIERLQGSKDGYNSNKSAFLRVMKAVSSEYYPDNWFEHVAWSNLYKAHPSYGGNPSSKICDRTLDSNIKIMKSEINILSPKVIIFLTGGWSDIFIKALNGEKMPEERYEEKFDSYSAKLYVINDTYYIASEHPQGKKEESHISAIKSLIDRYCQ